VGVVGLAAMERPDDWSCPNENCLNHTKGVFGSKANCPKCGAGRDDNPALQKAEKGMQGGDMPDDWLCPNETCKNHERMVFAKHTSCPLCGTARNAQKPGDWQCPNLSCLNHKNTVFASKAVCPRCNTPRPGTAFLAPPAVFQAPQPRMMMLRTGGAAPVPMGGGCFGAARRNGYGSGGGARAPLYGGGAEHFTLEAPPQVQSGDWQCPNVDCINNRKMVFGKNESCPKCGAPKEQQLPPRGLRSGGRVGDWACPNPDCRNHRNNVFAKHDSCPACGAEKPSDNIKRERSRSPRRSHFF